MNQIMDTITKATCDYIDAKSHPERIVCIEESIDMLRGLESFCKSRVTYLVKKRDESRKVIAQQAQVLSQVQTTMTPAEERIQAQKAKEARLQKCAEQKAKFLAELSVTKENTALKKDKLVVVKEAKDDSEAKKISSDEQNEDDMLLLAYESFLADQPRDSKEAAVEIVNLLVENVFDSKVAAEVAKQNESGIFSDSEATSPKISLIAKSATKLAQLVKASAAANAGFIVKQPHEQVNLDDCLELISPSQQDNCNSGVKRSSKYWFVVIEPYILT
jgi:hypothetical protein